MKSQQVINLLREKKPLLEEKFGVEKLALFGSTARDMATKDSDIDILISFKNTPNSDNYFGVLFYLEDLLKCPVDLVTEMALRQELRPFIEAEIIYV